MRIRYSSIAMLVRQRVRDWSEDEFHSLRGLIILLSTAPSTDGDEKKLEYVGNGIELSVYTDLDWRIAYRIEDDGDTLYIIHIQGVV